MSKPEPTASDAERAERQSDSVYDFLYNDSRRIGSFLAQFDDAGTLERITQSEAVAKRNKRGWTASVGGGIAELASASVSLERGPSEGGSESSERVYDPLWSNALTLLDYLHERNLLHRSVDRSRIGQFVLATGQLSIIDLAILKKLWELPSMRSQVAAAMGGEGNVGPSRQVRRQEGRRGPSAASKPDQGPFATEIVSIMPHALHALISSENYQVWCTLREEMLVATPADLFLKHGVEIPGEWTVLGVLDALPDNNKDAVHNAEVRMADSDSFGLQVLLGGFGIVVSSIAPLARQLLGRPASAYGITPLLIFREVAGS